MKEIVNYSKSLVWSLLASPKKDVKKSVKKLNYLFKKAEAIDSVPNKVRGAVCLYQVADKFGNGDSFNKVIALLKKKNYGQLDEAIKAFEALKEIFTNIGRLDRCYSYNKSVEGERATLENVYFGGILGLNLRPASYWIGEQDALQRTFHEHEFAGEKRSLWWIINHYQAGGFVGSHTNKICRHITTIRRVMNV